ncbi:MAG: patatin-like phospholipase family protein, partial [Nanoarchaeota archaeon]|nr:patatin-like phospholipase family protein [Nanoarchaeota archaeon]
MEKKVRILSLDGGGIRGIIPGEILAVLEEKIQKKTGNPQARLSSYFDLVAGTSTGGILALGLLCPQEEDLS